MSNRNQGCPTIYNADQLIATGNQNQTGFPDGRWVASRSLGWPGLCLRYRLLCAWRVFTGQADVLTWTDQ